MKKVLFVATVTRHIIGFHIPYLKLFKENGYEVHVASYGEEKIEYCDKHFNVPFTRSPFTKSNIEAYKQLKKIVDENSYDIIHCHTPVGGVITRLVAKDARKNGTRVIYTAHGFHFYKGAPLKNWLLYYPIEKYLSRYTDTLITINQEDYDIAKRKFYSKNIELVHGVGVDESKFNIEMSEKEKSDYRKSLGLKDEDFVMISIGELNNNKNQIMQIEAIKEIVKEKSDIKLLVVGSGVLEEFYKNKVKEYKLEDNIFLLGYRKDIPQLLKISNLAVSTSKREGLPVNVIEAMMSGLPVIATDCRGNRDLVDESNLVKIDDVEGLKDKVLDVCINEKELVKIINLKEFCKQNILSDIKKIYNVIF